MVELVPGVVGVVFPGFIGFVAVPVIRLEAGEILDRLFEDIDPFAVDRYMRELLDYTVIDVEAERFTLSGRAPVVFERFELLVNRPERKKLYYGLKPRLVKI